jgi:hypothetical protein
VYDLDRHRYVIRRHGTVSKADRAARAEAEAIVCELKAARITKTQIARLFDCHPRTITRILAKELVQDFSNSRGLMTELLENSIATRQAVNRLENTVVALFDRVDETLGGLVARYPELESDVDHVRRTLSLPTLDEDDEAA